jgi:hypothetical protein
LCRKTGLSVAKIADLIADEVEDDDMDTEHIDEEDGGKSDSDSDSDAEGEVRVFIAPPIEKAEAVTDGDSDDSDEPSGDVRHLPSGLLLSKATTSRRKRSAISNKKKCCETAEEEGPTDSGGGEAGRQWRRQDPWLVSSNILPFQKPALSPEDQEKLDGPSSAYSFYKLFQGTSTSMR